MTTPTLNLDTVYTVTSYHYKQSVLFTESEIPTIERQLAGLSIRLNDEGHLDRVGDHLVDGDGFEFAEVVSPEDLAYEANRQLYRVGAQSTAGIVDGDMMAAPGTHDNTLIIGDGVAYIEGHAAHIIYALKALDALSGMEAVWAALAQFPVTCDCGCCADCDTKPKHTEPEHYEPSDAELELWQDMCHEQYTGA